MDNKADTAKIEYKKGGILAWIEKVGKQAA